jgi:hypothetical protein
VRVGRAVALVGSTLLALAGVAAIWGGCEARGRLEPDTFGAWRIERRAEGQAVLHDLRRDGAVDLTLEASVDLCDPPVLAILDVDGDGSADLYHRHCRGHEFVRSSGGALSVVDLGQFDVADAPVLASFWGKEVFDWRGLRLLGAGAAALLAGIIGVAAFGLAGRARR